MASLETLLDVESEVEACFDSVLSSSPYTLAAIPSDTAAGITTPRTEIVAEVRQWGPHQFVIPSGTYQGRAVYDQFLMRLSIGVVFQPEHGQGQASIRGTVRKALTDWTRIKAAFATRGYLKPAPGTLRQVDGSRSVDDEEKTETIATVLELVCFVDQAALGAAT
jgi:hypothetical protein